MNQIWENTVLTIVTPDCPFCNKAGVKLRVNATDWERYNGGMMIQQAFPYLSADERELLKTGICNPCWTEIFSSEDD